MPPSVCPLRYDPFGMPPSAPRSRVQKALDDLHMGPREQVAAPWALLHPLSLIPYPCAAPPLLLYYCRLAPPIPFDPAGRVCRQVHGAWLRARGPHARFAFLRGGGRGHQGADAPCSNDPPIWPGRLASSWPLVPREGRLTPLLIWRGLSPAGAASAPCQEGGRAPRRRRRARYERSARDGGGAGRRGVL